MPLLSDASKCTACFPAFQPSVKRSPVGSAITGLELSSSVTTAEYRVAIACKEFRLPSPVGVTGHRSALQTMPTKSDGLAGTRMNLLVAVDSQVRRPRKQPLSGWSPLE